MSKKKLCALKGKREYTWLREKEPDELQVAYQNVLPSIRSAARLKGYAIGVHGSMRRDLDLIAAPWKSRASSQKALVKAIQLAVSNCREANPKMIKRPHGRNAYVIHIGTHAYIDLSIMPANRDKAHNTMGIAPSSNRQAEPLVMPHDWKTGETDIDGDFLCYIERTEECGAIWKYFDVVKNALNTWMLKDGEKVIAWTYLPKPPSAA